MNRLRSPTDCRYYQANGIVSEYLAIDRSQGRRYRGGQGEIAFELTIHLGQHSVEVLHDAGLSAGEIEKLIAEGSLIDAKLG